MDSAKTGGESAEGQTPGSGAAMVQRLQSPKGMSKSLHSTHYCPFLTYTLSLRNRFHYPILSDTLSHQRLSKLRGCVTTALHLVEHGLASCSCCSKRPLLEQPWKHELRPPAVYTAVCGGCQGAGRQNSRRPWDLSLLIMCASGSHLWRCIYIYIYDIYISGS